MTTSETLNCIIKGYVITRGHQADLLDINVAPSTQKFWEDKTEGEYWEGARELFSSIANGYIKFDVTISGYIGVTLVRALFGKITTKVADRKISSAIRDYLGLATMAFRLEIPNELQTGVIKTNFLDKKIGQ